MSTVVLHIAITNWKPPKCLRISHGLDTNEKKENTSHH